MKVWMEPHPSRFESFALKKGSPFLPFFKHVYQKVSENGQWNHLMAQARLQKNSKDCSTSKNERYAIKSTSINTIYFKYRVNKKFASDPKNLLGAQLAK